MSSYTELDINEADIQFNLLRVKYSYIIKRYNLLYDEISKKKKRQNLIINMVINLFRGNKFNKFKDLFKQLSILNFRSKNQIREIYIEIEKIREIAQFTQSGDYVPYDVAVNTPNKRNLVLELLKSQLNTKFSSIVASGKSQNKKTKRKRRKTKRRKTKRRKTKRRKKLIKK